jgi:hypothetical protein
LTEQLGWLDGMEDENQTEISFSIKEKNFRFEKQESHHIISPYIVSFPLT